jgi:excisionase family DNA binding protein
VPDEFLTVDYIAGLLKLDPMTIRNMIDRGELAAVRIGSRRVRIRRSEPDRFIAAGETVKRREPEPAEVDEDSITAWATFRSGDGRGDRHPRGRGSPRAGRGAGAARGGDAGAR